MNADNWEAYWKGDQAAHCDRRPSENPYQLGTPDHADWTRGYIEGQMIKAGHRPQ